MIDKKNYGVCNTNALLEAKGYNLNNLDQIPTKVFANLIDHTYLKPEGMSQNIIQLCKEAQEHQFMSVCVQPSFVSLAKSLLDDSVLVCTVVGFPLGMNVPSIKTKETEQALKDGANEIDMVLNVGLLKERKLSNLKEDIRAVANTTKDDYVMKVILETCLLDDEEIKIASEICASAGAHYVKTSTGFSIGGATLNAVKIMRDTVGDDLGVKASGGVKNLNDLKAMLNHGATRIGTSSGIQIIQGQNIQTNY